MRKTKIITMYLPQFHRVEENDKWWGQGFTDWVAVKDATPLFDGHYQPRTPLNDNYYDLLNKNTMKNQEKLMKKYHIYGQCFYHYWFQNGKKILEKPAEKLLEWDDIDIPFCFSWANESWTRTWSNLTDKNTWASKFEVEKHAGDDKGILLNQKYGNKVDWEEHFNYLLPFFKDRRYIRIEDKPIFVFYKPDIIICIDQMIEYWNELAEKNGLKGIYFIGSNTLKKSYLNAIVWQEPQMSLTYVNQETTNIKSTCFSFNKVWQQILSNEPKHDEKVFLGGFVGYDDTPRRGKGGTIIIDSNPEKFKSYFNKLLCKSEVLNSEFIFINAWNEWGEGMYLEPDEKYKYQYLSAIKKVMEQKNTNYVQRKYTLVNDNEVYLRKINEKYRSYWKILNKWLILKEENIHLDKYLLNLDIKRIGIYGIGMLGKHLIKELENSDIDVIFGIDQKADTYNINFPVFNLDHALPEVDAIIVTATYDYSSIKEQLKETTNIPVISLEQIIYEI